MDSRELLDKALFEKDDWSDGGFRARKPFKYYLRHTPAAPLSPGTKAVLWVVAFLVVAVLAAALVRSSLSPRGKSARPSRASVTLSRVS